VWRVLLTPASQPAAQHKHTSSPRLVRVHITQHPSRTVPFWSLALAKNAKIL
jgi:hypothetical protein